MDQEEQNLLLVKLADVLLWCFLLSVIVLIIWLVFFLIGGDWIYRMHSSWFQLSQHEYAMVNYYGLAFVKLVILLFFLIPYLAIKIALRKKD